MDKQDIIKRVLASAAVQSWARSMVGGVIYGLAASITIIILLTWFF